MRRASAALLVAGALVAPWLPSGAAGSTTVSAAAVTPYEIEVSGTGTGMYPDFDPATERYAVTTTDETDGTVTVSVPSTEAVDVQVNGRPAPGGSRTLEGLKGGDEISVFVTHAGTTAAYSFVYLPAGFPTLRRDTSVGNADTPSPGLVMLTLAKWLTPSPFFETAVDANGVPAYVSAQQSALDLKRQPNGHYSVSRGVGGAAASEVVELDEQFREVERYSTVGLVNTDNHDSILLPDRSRYLLAYEPDTASGKTDAVVQHVAADGDVLFEWNSRDHVDLATEPLVPSDDPDYAHVNSVHIMADGDLLVSFRHLSSVFKIARSAHDGFAKGEVVWKLGGRDSDFTFVDSEGADDGGPCAQHTATELSNGDIMVFDNGAWAPDPYCIDPADPDGPGVARPLTRVTVWSPDVQTGVATMVRNIEIGNRFALFAGSAQPLDNDNVVIGWASATAAIASEVGPDGSLLWELVDEGSPKYFTYRAFKTDVPDHQHPVVSVVEPVDGATYQQGQVVAPSVDCTDKGGSSLRTCSAPSVDTTTPGTHTYTAVAMDGAGNQTTVQRTYIVLAPPAPPAPPDAVPTLRPDAMIRKVGQRPFRGDDVYGVRSGQKVRAKLWRPESSVTAVVKIENDGDTADRFTVRKKVTAPDFSVRLRLPDGKRTSPVLDPGESWKLRVRVVRTRKAEAGDRGTVVVVVRSAADGSLRDKVWLRFTAADRHQRRLDLP